MSSPTIKDNLANLGMAFWLLEEVGISFGLMLELELYLLCG